MDNTYFEATYIIDGYYNYTASASSQLQAFDIITCMSRVLHLIEALNYKIRQETRFYSIRAETRYKSIRQ